MAHSLQTILQPLGRFRSLPSLLGQFMLAFVLLVSGCSQPLKVHAVIASAARDAIDAAGGELIKEVNADIIEIEQSHQDVDHRIAVLRESVAPAESAYRAAVAARVAYTNAIWAALERGDDKLAADTPAALLSAFRALQDVGSAFGFKVPDPPESLVKLLEGS